MTISKKSTWQLQEAKNKLSHVANQAKTSGPQIITRHGKPDVVLIDYAEAARFLEKQPNIVDFFKNSPLFNADIDLERTHDTPKTTEID